MRPLGVILSVVIGIGALSGTIWMTRYAPWVKPTERPKMVWENGRADTPEAKEALRKAEEEREKEVKAAKEEEAKKLDPRPKIASAPPYPKVVTGERIYEFGGMGVNEEKKHKFKIENKGQAPLLLAKGPTTCKCTISNASKREIPPGDSAEIEMSWTPKEAANNFAQTATIYTNDPETPEIQFKVFGRVAQLFTVYPSRGWNAGYITDVQDGSFVGRIGSELDENFKITSIETKDPHIKVESRPLKKLEMRRDGMRGGYELTMKIDKGIAMGPFRSSVQVHTTLEGNKTINIDVHATRSGPILYLPPVPLVGKMAYWNAERSTMNLGRIEHDTGCKVALPALVYAMKDKFKLVRAKSDLDFVKVSVEPNPEIGQGEQQGVRFIFEIPPGSPSVTRVSPNAVHVTLETNHPKLKEINFALEFVTR